MSTTADFLVELRTEELPPKALFALSQAFEDELIKRIAAAGLARGQVERFATPRRLAVLIRALALQAESQIIQRRGPPITAAFDKEGKPTRAAEAFAQSCQVQIAALERETDAKGNECLSFRGEKPGVKARDVLAGYVDEALGALPIPKRMRWGAGDAQFARPVHGLILLLGGSVLKATVLGAKSDRTTVGHRFMSKGLISIKQPADYAKTLQSRGFVIADFAQRREVIRSRVVKLAEKHGGKALVSDSLLDEVAALTEWPIPMIGNIEPRFLELPRELLISVLQDHQRYFPVAKKNGALLPLFVFVSNIKSRSPGVVRAGNERVVRPRLSDAAFFWDQDRKQPLKTRRESLNDVVFQAQLGSIGDKVQRITALAREIAELIGADRARAAHAASLCKCDLVTNLVGEFPELQGIMGSYYALADGEPPEIAKGIVEHYLPRGAGDALPDSSIGVAVALADRIDTLTGIFAIGQKPSGTKDPFALRRAAIGVLRILLEKRLGLDLLGLIERSLELHALRERSVNRAAVCKEVYDYMMERLRSMLIEAPEGAAAGTASELFDAVLAAQRSVYGITAVFETARG
jgi:glycyl-tRNA synthetase beta chain